MNYWLFKSEPDVFGIQHLKARPKKTEHWDGVRNYQARNFMRDAMRKGDLGFFYHSSCAEPGITGIVEIVRAGYPDHTAFDPENSHYDPKSTSEKPIWYMVDVRLKREFKNPVTLQAMKSCPALKGMRLLARGNRLSVMPVARRDWDFILKLADN
ncbi:MAG: EVE domain-containing protein [Candidatus Muproteobacteria bacterium RBG_19FT_COMBO_61_10]|jgi:predicted RNA-binding protein with PUA-like domain|uniref:EVE domain-containing protein n=1 Tax=Candidatus Muproteobacteria bacterium RBG_19FT_COMBO_61_10 TaxID=1817761 RepID=A0A1F6UN19_9PROT|nr:MAG: EVE domain-containing protein [Candidatus Muproteobacteria bacterium RBG_19FT_COMBO_61_10]